jgi:hypothetical protein
MIWQRRYLAEMAAVIDRYGHAVQYVLDDVETGAPSFAYTVGLHVDSERGYELAVSGLPPNVSVGLLNELAIALAGRHVAEGLEVHDLLQDGVALHLRQVTRPEGLTIIHAFYNAIPPVWQALWPDRGGHYPGETGYTLPATAQTLL